MSAWLIFQILYIGWFGAITSQLGFVPKLLLFSNFLTSSALSVQANVFCYWVFFLTSKILYFFKKIIKNICQIFFFFFFFLIILQSILFLKIILNNVPIAYQLNFLNIIIRNVYRLQWKIFNAYISTPTMLVVIFWPFILF